jgi:hypothetical protein
MIHSKQSVALTVAKYYDIPYADVFADEDAKAVCLCLSLKHLRYPLGTEEEQDEAKEAVLNSPVLRNDLECIEQSLLVGC